MNKEKKIYMMSSFIATAVTGVVATEAIATGELVAGAVTTAACTQNETQQ